MTKFNPLILLFLCFSLLFSSLEAAYTIKNGWIVDASEIATLPVADHYALGMQAMETLDWNEACRQFRIITVNFPTSAYGQEGFYYLGMCYFHLDEYDFANEAFSSYLKCVNNPRFFQESVQYKFQIAEKFKAGAKRRILGTKKLPKWASGASLALKIYDEVIAAVPSNELAARALISKGCQQWEMKDYKDAIEAFQMVIRRFPKSELAPECYLLITKVFLDQSQYEFQNPDLLAFAQINLRKFKQDFPREERLAEAEDDVLSIKEVYAQGLYETGQFYERTNKPRASIIYYYNAIRQFPDTHIAELCRQRLAILEKGKLESQTQPS